MMFFGRRDASLDSRFLRQEVAEVNLAVANADARSPLLSRWVETDSFDTAEGFQRTSVGHILSTVSEPKITESVIVPVTIDVIDLLRWPHTVQVEPHETMGIDRLCIDRNNTVTSRNDLPCLFARVASVPLLRTFGSEKPCEDASLGVVGDHLEHSLLSGDDSFITGYSAHADQYVGLRPTSQQVN